MQVPELHREAWAMNRYMIVYKRSEAGEMYVGKDGLIPHFNDDPRLLAFPTATAAREYVKSAIVPEERSLLTVVRMRDDRTRYTVIPDDEE
jgi:hypothetical protein